MLSIGDLTDKLTVDLARPMIIKLAQDRIQNYDITTKEIDLLKKLVSDGKGNASQLAEQLNQSRQSISKILNRLLDMKLVTVNQIGRIRNYYPTLDAEIAYSNVKN